MRQFTPETTTRLQQTKQNITNSNTINFLYIKQILYYLISTYGWLSIFGIIIYYGFKFPYYHPPQTFTSKIPSKPWNHDDTPKILAHITDIHLSSFLNHKTQGSSNYLKEFFKYKPDLILNGGDVVDNYEERSWPKVGSQWIKDWKIYINSIRKKLEKLNVLDISGNHDVFAVDSLLSKHNYFLDYSFVFNRSNVKTIDDFIVRKVEMFNETFILFNDYRFPTTHPPYGLTPHPSKHMLDLLENAIDSSKDCIILGHYQVDRTWFIKSSKGNDYKDIISKKNVKVIFSGHFHPRYPMIIHHGQGAVEFCTSSPYNHKIQALITIDNGQIVYHPAKIISPEKRPLFFMTYPIPKEQISSHHTFSYKNSEIRVISYAEKKVSLKIDGDINGEMIYVKTLSNGADLYSYPINLPYGKYKIHITGDGCNLKREFVIGEKYKGVAELSARNPKGFLIFRITSIPFFIILLIIIFPFGKNLKTAEKLNDSLFKLNNEEIINGKLKYIIKLIIFGPFIIRQNYKNVNSVTKKLMIFFIIYPFILPNHVFKPIYGVKGFSFNVFIVIGKRIQFEDWALQMTYSYFIAIILPNVIFLSGLKFYKNSKFLYWTNFAVTIYTWWKVNYINKRYVGESIWWPYLFLTPIYMVIPIIIKIIIHKFSYLVENITTNVNKKPVILYIDNTSENM